MLVDSKSKIEEKTKISCYKELDIEVHGTVNGINHLLCKNRGFNIAQYFNLANLGMNHNLS